MSVSDIIHAVNFVAEHTVAPIVKQVKYVLDYKQNLINLPKEAEKLTDLKQEVEGLVSSARGNAEDIKPSVEAWVKEADLIAEAARQMIREEEELSKKKCFIGLCSNPVSRHRSSRNAFKETTQIIEAQKAGRELKEGSVSFPVSAVPSFSVTVTLGKDFLDFSSRSKTWEDIIKALKDPETNVIGVYGMGGLGKTTLVKQVAARAAEEKLFREVVMPLVTEKNVVDVKEFQEEMAKVLNMKLEAQWNQLNVSQRAGRILKRLTCDEKKTIVILDDLRTKLDLEQVGIPVGAGIKGCKILFTSRFQYISYATQKNITLGVLEEEESWRLFQKTVGDVLEDPAFLNVGKEVTKNCKGLPILVVTVAGALLCRRSLGAWKDALRRLEREGSKEMQEFVYSALEFISFNHLSDANKSLFLLCGLVGGGEISIFDQLLKLGMGWGLFKHTKTMEEARNNLDTLIHDLKASFLLLDGESVDSVRMHDVVRDVAIKIASNEEHNMLLGSSNNWPEDDAFRRCIALTFPYGIVPELPECLVSPSLEFLLLYHNHTSLKITGNLFEKMLNLTVLDIRSVDLSPTLPSSLALLQNLQALSLNLCNLRDISIVGALKKLKTLSLSQTDIEELPMEIGSLTELRVLDLNSCSQLKVIPPSIMQRLSKLEEFHMTKTFFQWRVEGLASSERRNASLDELNCLVNLTTLRIHIPDAKFLPQDFYCEKLERFMISIGNQDWYWKGRDEKSVDGLREIKIKINGGKNIHFGVGVQEMLKRTEILSLDGMKNIHELEWRYFQELKFVRIHDSAETPYILNGMESFPRVLESLFLSHLPQLENLCRGMFMAESSFNKLKFVGVNNCNSLRNLFSFSMARGLPHLEKVKVTDCDSLEAIVGDTREDGKIGDTVLEFCQLRSLILIRLPKLASFCSSVKVLFPKLEELTLDECDSMEYLFNQSIVTSLEQLKVITVAQCRSLKGVFAQDEGEETNETIKFPQLVDLLLEELPCLTRFCSGCSIVFPTLTRLFIRQCLQLKTFLWTNKKLSTAMQPLFDEKVELPNLKELDIFDLNNVETIWHNRLHEDSFFKLEQVNIGGCPNLLKIFPSTMLGRIQRLGKLWVQDSCLVEEVFGNDEMTKPNCSQGGETTEDKIRFPQLRCLELMRLSNLKQFCSGSCVVFPALTELTIWKCEQMETFMYPIGVSNSRRKGVEDMDSNDMQPLFNDKVEFPSLKRLDLKNLGNIKIIWDSRIHEDSFSTLEKITIGKCARLLRIFPLAMLGRIRSLKELSIVDSGFVEEIFEAPINTQWPHTNGTIDVMVSDLYLENLPKLKCVWREDLVRIISVRNLHKVDVRGCQSLEYLFPPSVAQHLYHLKEINITDCGVETIVCRKEEEVKEEATAFVFPKLVNLYLEGLPKLQSFYPGRHTTQWPSLKKLLLEGMFHSDLVKFADNGGGSLLIPILEKIESLEVVDCPVLISIGLVSFKFLTELEVWNCDGLVSLVQFSTAKSMVQLTRLKVTGCETIKEIVASHESADGAEEDEIVFSKLNTLRLEKLPSLVNFYLGNCILKFPLLEQVTVEKCNNIKAFCGGITITPKLKTVYLNYEKMDIDKDLNTIIKEGHRPAIESPTSSSEHFSEAEDDICENSNEPGTVSEPGKKCEASTVIVKQDRRAETCEMNDGAANSPVEAESSKKAIQLKKNDGICEKIIEPRKEGESCGKIDTCKARNEAEALQRPYLVKGSLAPTPDTADVTFTSSQSHPALGATTCQQNSDFQGLQVTQHLVPLLEKARDRHGDFHTSPLIKLKTVRIIAMDTVGQVLHILQTQTPRTINAEKIQFMEDAYHDLSNMSFPIEWLHPLINKASKCLLSAQSRTVVYELKAKIDEMEAQLKMLKGEMEVETAKLEEFDEQNGSAMDLDQPLLDI